MTTKQEDYTLLEKITKTKFYKVLFSFLTETHRYAFRKRKWKNESQQENKKWNTCLITKRLLDLQGHKEITIFDMTDDEKQELKARIEAAKQDLGFFSLNWDAIRETEWITEEELEESINDCLDDLSDALRKLNDNDDVS